MKASAEFRGEILFNMNKAGAKNLLKGFTLIELLVYISILIVAVTVVTSFAMDVMENNRSAQGNRDTQQNARLVMERLQFTGRWANNVVAPYQAHEITFQTFEGDVRFYLAPGQGGQTALFVDRNGQGQQLTSDSVAVTDFNIAVLDPGSKPVSFTVHIGVQSVKLEPSASSDLDSIITLRKH